VRNDKLKALRAKLLLKRKDQNKKRQHEYLTRAQKYHQEYETTFRDLINLQRKVSFLFK